MIVLSAFLEGGGEEFKHLVGGAAPPSSGE